MNNMYALMSLLKSGGNPQSILMNMVQNQASSNPIMGNVFSMMQNGNTNGIEQMARNLCRERGINPDEMYSQIKNKF